MWATVVLKSCIKTTEFLYIKKYSGLKVVGDIFDEYGNPILLGDLIAKSGLAWTETKRSKLIKAIPQEWQEIITLSQSLPNLFKFRRLLKKASAYFSEVLKCVSIKKNAQQLSIG